MDSIASIVAFFQQGGFFMLLITAVLVLGLAIAIERWHYLRRASQENRRVWSELLPLMNQGEYEAAEQLAAGSETAIGRVLGNGLARSKNHATRAEVEIAIEESLMEVVPLLERRTHYLATFANVATLLGLLGTIIGLIEGFTAVANVNPAEKANMLASAISIAMNTTAYGLITAIPLLLAHSWLQTIGGELVDSLEMASTKFINSLGLKQ